MHIIDCSVEPILSGWITGRSNVIEPIGLSTVLSTGVNAVLVNETSCNDKLDNYGSTITSSTGRVAQNDSCGCFGGCVGFGSGGSVTLDLKLSKRIYWKGDGDDDPLQGGKNANIPLKKNVITIGGGVKIQNSSKEEIPQLKVNVIRHEQLIIKSGNQTHKKSGHATLSSVAWGPILPNSVFTRDLDLSVNLTGQPASCRAESGAITFTYEVQLAIKDVATCQVPIVVLEGKGPTGRRGQVGYRTRNKNRSFNNDNGGIKSGNLGGMGNKSYLQLEG